MPSNLPKPKQAFFLPIFLFFLFTCFHNKIAAQTEDTVLQLNEVVVKAYEQNKRLRDVPAAVNYISRQAMERFSTVSIVQAVNTTPGVRMEERSPGSYRFNIRGSSLRSPFGIRNVKVYYNDLPFTDPGGHTYLNQLGYYNFNSLEIIKGPGSSLYGAGTGGVLLVESINPERAPGVFAEYATGSYGLHNAYASFTAAHENGVSRTGYQHQQSNGYRHHSNLRRDVLSWDGLFKLAGNRHLKTTFLYSDLFYNTPGALTLSEFKANPRSARPSAGGFPGSVAARAAIYQKTVLAGASLTQPVMGRLTNKSVLYGAYTQLHNPTLRNYGRSNEPHVGGRTLFAWPVSFTNAQLAITAGAEWQQGFTSFSIHKNVGGEADSIITFDDVRNRQSFIFAQAALETGSWTFTASASLNQLNVLFKRFSPTPIPQQQRRFSNELAPRFAIAKKWPAFTIYSSVAKGFSPPTTSELLPTGGAINLDLFAEEGINYDLGWRGFIAKRLYADVNAFVFRLQNTIVQRRDAGGGDFFINAGKTAQYGVETTLRYPLLQTTVFKQSELWSSYTWHRFKYTDFKQLTFDFSGNCLPGVAPHTVAAGYDFLTIAGFLGAVTYLYTDVVPLTDANTVTAPAYHVVGAKIGYEHWVKSVRLKAVVGADNLLNATYSLGNDINGFGGRYYNAAPGRNYYVSFIFQWVSKKFM